MQTAKVIPFQFKSTEVRTLEIDSQVWFVAGDVAKALDYRDAEVATRHLDDDEKGVHPIGVPPQPVTVINESGLYALILKSRKPEAVPFRKWVTGEVLPAIRKTGRYEPRLPPEPVPVLSTSGINQIAWRVCHGLWPEMVRALAEARPLCGHRRMLVTVDTSQGTPVVGVCPVPVTSTVIDRAHLDKLRDSARDAAATFLQGPTSMTSDPGRIGEVRERGPVGPLL